MQTIYTSLFIALILIASFSAPTSVKAQSIMTDDVVTTLIKEVEAMFRSGKKDLYKSFFDNRAKSKLTIALDLEDAQFTVSKRDLGDIDTITSLMNRANFSVKTAHIARDNKSAGGKVSLQRFEVDKKDNIIPKQAIECGYQILLTRRDQPQFTKFSCTEQKI